MAEPSSLMSVAAAATAEELAPFLVQIGQVYEGPFDLLLDLIRRQNINIYDIPIAAITTQYLAYLARLRDLDVEVAAEFLVVAATLIQIKSKMMLPADPVLPGEVAADPRDELVQRLLEHEAFKQAAAQLHERQQLEEASWSRPQLWEIDADDEPGELVVEVHDLVATFRQVLERLKERPQLEILREEVSVREMMEHLHRLLADSEEPVAVRPLFLRARSRSALLATFLAVLELVKMNVAQLRQERAFGEILLKRHRRFHQAWNPEVVSTFEDPLESGPEPA
ncbi:MAG TPA: segregation/condensation protein A [Terriglobales bacterium]|nr:segregation/condensation protein A [Terriglobales bacterium]